MVPPASLKRYTPGLSGSCAAFSRGSIGHKTQIYNRQTTSIILDRIGVQGDLRDRHAILEDNLNSRRGLPTFWIASSTRAGSATGVLLKTSQAKRRHEAEVVYQAKEGYRHAKRSRPARLGSAACGKRS